MRDSAGGSVIGHIKHNESLGNCFVVCGAHAQCIRTRTLRTGRGAGAGAPLGFLAAWCKLQGQYHSKSAHMAAGLPSFQARRSARDLLKAEHNYLEFVGLEQRIADPGDTEPEEVPQR